MSDVFSFRLSDDFVTKYAEIEPPFGFKDAFLSFFKEAEETLKFILHIFKNI